MAGVSTKEGEASIVDSERRRRNARTIALLRRWLAEPDEPLREDADGHPDDENSVPPIRLRDAELIDP